MAAAVPPTKTRCCRTTPRCRSCPLRFAAELRDVRALADRDAKLPPYLDGVPACLHKYEPLFRRAEEPASR
jgi:hypothetical protein